MTYADMFSRVKGMLMDADVSDIHEHLAYQFNITGEAEGIFYAEVKDGKLSIEPYEYFDRDAMFTCSATGMRCSPAARRRCSRSRTGRQIRSWR